MLSGEISFLIINNLSFRFGFVYVLQSLCFFFIKQIILAFCLSVFKIVFFAERKIFFM